MLIFPAIDLYGGQAVRLLRGDYAQMTVYADDPPALAERFAAAGATHMHVVDLEGAKTGRTENFGTILQIKKQGGLFVEVGGGIRDAETVARYLDAGIDRVILGTAAVTDEKFLCDTVSRFGDKIAVGMDVRDGYVAIRGWTENSAIRADDFVTRMKEIGVGTLIVTDISRDGAMKGTNLAMYRSLASCGCRIVASGGVSTLDDVRALRGIGLYGAIIGKAYYTGAVELSAAIGEARE